jgi:DNA invertase Pin-like site-specific DNA recombinase
MQTILSSKAAPSRLRRSKPKAPRLPQQIGYGRVSTADQHPEVQGAALRDAGCSQVFTETISSRKTHRPQLAAALAALQPGDTLTIVRLDRLARSLRELLEIAADLEERGIALKVLTQGIDTSTPTGRLMFGMLGAIAQFERDLSAERLAESIRHRKVTGGDLGGRRPSYSDGQHRLVHERVAQGATVREIAAELNLSRSVVGRLAKMAHDAELSSHK